MANSKSAIEKKAIINKIKPLIVSALEGIEKKKGEKKFENGINKAAKLLAKKLKLPTTFEKANNAKAEKKVAGKIPKQPAENKTLKKDASYTSAKKKEMVKKENISITPRLTTKPENKSN